MIVDKTILERVKKHKDYLVNEYNIPEYKILGVFAYGSMNYGTYVDDKSDVDTKAIYVPDYDEVLWNKPIAKEYTLPHNEHCELKDIREMVKMYSKQNINFIETLFTPYCWINPLYQYQWDLISKDKEFIAHYDEEKTVLSTTGQALNTLRQIRNSQEYNGKKLANCIRLAFFFVMWSANMPYWDCIYLTGEALDLVKRVKYSTEPISPNTIDEEYRDLLNPDYLTAYFNMLKLSSWDGANKITYKNLQRQVTEIIRREPIYEQMWRIENELSKSE